MTLAKNKEKDHIFHMPSLSGLSFNWALLIIGVILAFYGLRAALGYRNVARDAQDDYDYKAQHNMLPMALSKDGYIRAYRRFNNPRGPLYVAVVMASILILTPVAMIAIQFLLEQLYQITGRSRVFEPGYLVWQFLIYFLLLLSWASIAYFGARRFYRRAPGTLSEEFEKESNLEK